jgi:hypothetical protein
VRDPGFSMRPENPRRGPSLPGRGRVDGSAETQTWEVEATPLSQDDRPSSAPAGEALIVGLRGSPLHCEHCSVAVPAALS